MFLHQQRKEGAGRRASFDFTSLGSADLHSKCTTDFGSFRFLVQHQLKLVKPCLGWFSTAPRRLEATTETRAFYAFLACPVADRRRYFRS